MIQFLLATFAAAQVDGTCDPDNGGWVCETVFNGTVSIGGLETFGIGGGIVTDSTTNDVWFVMNRLVEGPMQDQYVNKIYGARGSCDDAICSSSTNVVGWTDLLAVRGGKDANTAPSIAINREATSPQNGNPRLYVLTCCSRIGTRRIRFTIR
jgi:hypothetical protein